ncbi:tRNA guanosine(34) transglycosylase Tgt [Parvularcula dongshanensis]|uniref:Queuine tRNA-ribosyltransferase n=1 Tax=Parvularcula dongshanensis TaxID=1173995 RepID=A0A840I531_9PROT|nr:tRNA guanosine(34) transglycosylase Tgt [Parvularcula dongshanensis]MBB4659278.1 queuine tRNA-ribosyltransferase [Parvularcula dongshanensis]
MTPFTLELTHTDGAARRGRITTSRGPIDTPAFMPVGTAGTVKAMQFRDVKQTGAQVVLGNTYHLMLRPTAERVDRFGGLHRFMGWDGPILTDSGGFQVMSLTDIRKLTEEGVEFASHIDGSRHMLTPERSIEVQCLLHSDIQMQLDECPPFPIEEAASRESMEMSVRWAKRSKAAFERMAGGHQALFGIVQGSVFPDQRAASVRALTDIGFHGYSVGGLAVGEGREAMLRVLDATCPLLPEDKPHYLMGVGKPLDILGAVERGIDMFDCVLPTRAGRHGQAWTWDGPINLKNARFADDEAPLDATSDCPASRDYSKAYLHHLFRAGEYLAATLLTWHNLAFYQALMRAMRDAIEAGAFAEFAAAFRARHQERAGGQGAG